MEIENRREEIWLRLHRLLRGFNYNSSMPRCCLNLENKHVEEINLWKSYSYE